MRTVAVLHHRWFYNSCVISAYVIVTIWQKCLFYVHAGAQNRAQFPEGICVCSFMWCCGNLCHCQYWQGNCYDVSKSLWPSESKVVGRVHVFSCSNWLHAVYIKHEMYCGDGFICRWVHVLHYPCSIIRKIDFADMHNFFDRPGTKQTWVEPDINWSGEEGS